MSHLAVGGAGVAGAVAGAVSTVFFHAPSLNETALKIAGLAALQGGVVQTLGFEITKDYNGQFTSSIVVHLFCTAALTVAVKVILNTTPQEAIVNYALSSIVGWVVVWLILESEVD